MSSNPLPLVQPAAPPPADPGPPARRPNGGDSAWRVLLAVMAGFAMPVLACYGLVLVTALACQVLALPIGRAPAGPNIVSTGTGPAVAVIRAQGLIVLNSPGGLNQGVLAADALLEQVRQAEADDDVRAIVLYIDSSGGGANASDVIYQALKQVEKPIVVQMGDTAASGGYYIAMAADWIIANPNTLTGSIGVISQFVNAGELLDEVGVEFVVITSGPAKDFGSPYREMTEAEREYWQAMVDEIYADFLAVVAEGRGLTVDEVLPLADGRVYTGRQALEAGLVDQLGYEADAIAHAAALGGITGEPRIIEYEAEPRLLDLLAGLNARGGLLPNAVELLQWMAQPSLAMRWVGP